jgi:hypothetical protein
MFIEKIQKYNESKNSGTKIAALLILVIPGIILGGLVGQAIPAYASHTFELGVTGNTVPDNTQIRLDGIRLPPGGVLPLYDASPNFVAGHFLLRAPCDETTHAPFVTVMAGHIDEHADQTHVGKMPLFYISHASTAGSCVFHAHIPDPLNGDVGTPDGAAPRVTDIDLINLSGEDVSFLPGDAVDINIQRVLGSMRDNPYGPVEGGDGLNTLPTQLTGFNPICDLNDPQATPCLGAEEEETIVN